MPYRGVILTKILGLAFLLALSGKGLAQSFDSGAPQPATSYQLTVTLAGTGGGTVSSSPAGIGCQPTCSNAFASGTVVKLTAVAAKGSVFTGWAGACTGRNSTCNVTMNTTRSVTATFNISQTVNLLQHIVFMAQENRSLDHYFGAFRAYWAANGIHDQSFDGLPQFNPTSGIAPLYGPPPTNPGCDPAHPTRFRVTVRSTATVRRLPRTS
jgi:phospholipase C